jgi:exonuclease III
MVNPMHTGVGFYVSEEVNQKVESVRFISDRIIQLILKLDGGGKLRLTQVYAPQSGHEEDVHEAFYEALSNALEGRFAHNIVLGDFNAIIGPTQSGDACCGKYGTGVRNERGEAFIDFCKAEDLFIMNSFFKSAFKGNGRGSLRTVIRATKSTLC